MLVISTHAYMPCTPHTMHTMHSEGDVGSGTARTHVPCMHIPLVQDGFPTPELQGLIPNSFEHIFQEVEASTDKQWMVRASYLEIYNEEVRGSLQGGGGTVAGSICMTASHPHPGGVPPPFHPAFHASPLARPPVQNLEVAPPGLRMQL